MQDEGQDSSLVGCADVGSTVDPRLPSANHIALRQPGAYTISNSQPDRPYHYVPVRGETSRAHHSSWRQKAIMRVPNDWINPVQSLSRSPPNGGRGLLSTQVYHIEPPSRSRRNRPTPCSFCIGRCFVS
jgi:hypothetical protein